MVTQLNNKVLLFLTQLPTALLKLSVCLVTKHKLISFKKKAFGHIRLELLSTIGTEEKHSYFHDIDDDDDDDDLLAVYYANSLN